MAQEPSAPRSSEERISLIQAADTTNDTLRALLAGVGPETPPAEVNAWLAHDRASLKRHAGGEGPLALPLALALGRQGSPAAIGHLHEVFESYPERRQSVAAGLAEYAVRHRRRAEDWRLLIRSLTVVEGEIARQVLQALALHNERATKARWLRQVILIGLQLDERGAQDAANLLRHWTGAQPSGVEAAGKDSLAAWQAWFQEQYPEELPAVLPQSRAEARWTYAKAWVVLQETPSADAARGKLAFQKASCHKCHALRPEDKALGPDLARIADRMQRKEVLHAILFPSEYISDQYQTQIVQTRDGRTFTGVVGAAPGGAIVIQQQNGELVMLRRNDVETTAPARLSVMAENTLDELDAQELADLFAYLMQRERTP